MQRSLAAATAANNDTIVPHPAAFAPLDMSVLEAGRRLPPPLPPAMFGAAWKELERLAVDKGCPLDYVALSYLAISAGLIGAKRRVRAYATSTWIEPAILWLGLVGDPSSNKSPALDPMTRILKRLEGERAADHGDALRGWEADCARAKVERAQWEEAVKAAAKDSQPTPRIPSEAIAPDEPKRRRLFVQDTTPEGMAEVLAGNPQGTLLLRDELAGWLTSFDRYNTGGDAFWLEAYNGRQFTIDRKGRPDPLTVPFNGVSIVGGIQPEKLAGGLFGKADDGMPARFMWVWPDRPPFQRPSSAANVQGFEDAARRLEGLPWGIGEQGEDVAVILPLDPDAEDVFECIQQHHRAAGDDATGLLKSFIGKLDGIALRMALTVELAQWAYSGGPEPRSIRSGTIEAVGDFLSAYAVPMAARVYGDAALPPLERNAATLARYVRRNKLASFNGRKLRRDAQLPGMREAGPFNEALDALTEAGWLRPNGKRAGDSPGRHTSDYAVNPAIHGGA